MAEAEAMKSIALKILLLCTHSPVIALFEHVLALRVERPVISLALSSALSRHFDEALVERQVVTNRILPPFLVLLVKREFVDDELVDLR